MNTDIENQTNNQATIEQNQKDGTPAHTPEPKASPALLAQTNTPSASSSEICQPSIPSPDSPAVMLTPMVPQNCDPEVSRDTNPILHSSINPASSIALNHHRGRLCKVAKLPPELIAFVNEELLSSVPYAIIVQELAEKGYNGFNTKNIGNWKLSGFKKWVEEQQSLEQQNHQRQLALDYAVNRGCSLLEALCQVSAHNLYETAISWNPSHLVKKMEENPELFLKLNHEISAFMKICEAIRRSASNVKKTEENTRLSKSTFREEAKGGLTLEQRDAAARRLGIY